MKKQVIKLFDKIILLLLGIAGAFTGCKQDCETYSKVPFSNEPFSSLRPPYPEGTVMYGVPAVYLIKGDVKNEANGKSIPNIRVIAENADTIYTDSKGKYFYKFSTMDLSDFYLTFEDIDGQANGGEFVSQEKKVIFTEANRVDQEKCSEAGRMFVKTQNIKLKKKK